RPEGRLDRRYLRAHDRPGHRRAALTRRDGRGARDPRAGALAHRRADEQDARAARAQPRLRADARDRALAARADRLGRAAPSHRRVGLREALLHADRRARPRRLTVLTIDPLRANCLINAHGRQRRRTTADLRPNAADPRTLSIRRDAVALRLRAVARVRG